MLKARKMTYHTLGGWIGMSESGVKKLLNAEDGSVGRLADICNALGLSLATLVAEAEGAPPQHVPWTPGALAFFEEHPAHWQLLWELYERDLDIEGIRHRHGLDEASMDRYLADLERLGYVRRAPDGRVITCYPTRSGWGLSATLGERALWPIQQGLLDHVRVRMRQPEREQPELDLLAMIRPQLRPESAMELRQALLDTIREFARRADRERDLYPEQDKMECGAMILVAPFALHDAVTLPPLQADPTVAAP
ncbi:MAG: helix-turn-helix transcriptional regulator [Myxococcota bacterium]